MSQSDQTLEEREKELSARIQTLERQLDRLSARMGDGDDPGAPHSPIPAAAAAKEKEYVPDEITDVSEEVLNWAGRTSLLPRLATLCFLLVVALILRTITESGLVNALVGSGIGMSYAAILMIVSWYKYREQSPLAPIIAASGAILMSTIVVETHTHFNSLPVVPAYLTLIVTGIAMALISRQFNAFTPISVGILGMCFAGAAMDYPRPFFPYLALVLFTANLLGYFASQLKRCTWLRWSALFVTIAMLQLWQSLILTAFKRGETTPEMAISWFLPVVAVFAVTYMALALFGIIRRGSDKLSKYIVSLPTISALWVFTAATYVLGAQGGNTQLLGIIGSVFAFCHFGVTFWLARRNIEGAPGSSSFTLAGGALLALALPVATGSFMLSLPVISIVAIVVTHMSRTWGSGTLRLTAYLFQIYCCVAMAVAFRGVNPAAMSALNIIPTGLMTGVMLYQYKWCRLWSPLKGSSFFSRFDTHDRSAAVLLLSGLISGFFMMRIAMFQAIAMLLPEVTHSDAFRCSQSVLINCAAIALILFAFLRKNKEIRNVAIFVMVIGGIKVFLYDLTGTHGLPLVFSVFSFGMAAAVESIALGKWQKQPDYQTQKEPVDDI